MLQNNRWIPINKSGKEYEHTPVQHIFVGDFIVPSPAYDEVSTHEGQEIVRITRRTFYKKEDIKLEWECVHHPKGNKAAHHGDDNHYYSSGYYPYGKELLVLNPNVVNMIKLRE